MRAVWNGFRNVRNPWGSRMAVTHPARYTSWRERSESAIAEPNSLVWSDGVGPSDTSGARLAVVMHVHFPELVDELITHLAHVPIPFDLYVTNSSGSDLDIDRRMVPNAQATHILNVDNHGRDILPFITLINADVLQNYSLVLKVHTKKSAWREQHATLAGSGADWRAGFLADLLGSPEQVQWILTAFQNVPNLGTVTSRGSITGPESWGSNRRIVAEVLRRINFTGKASSLRFASGSMYWIRGQILTSLRELRLTPDDFESEGAQIDGTTAHAVERILGMLADRDGYTMIEADHIVAVQE